MPHRPFAFTLVLAAAASIAVAAPTGDVKWETSLDQARARAAREGRPILLLEMFGRLDDAFC